MCLLLTIKFHDQFFSHKYIWWGKICLYMYVFFCFFLCSSNRVVQPASKKKMAKKKKNYSKNNTSGPGNSSNT